MAARAGPAFPDGFAWGAATSAYQIEGAVGEDGRGPSIWDEFCRRPGAIVDDSDGSVAADHYHRYRDDVALMRELGLGAYRFSIAWPRVVPEGSGAVNAAGLDFYDRLVDELLAAGIAPWVTLYHWDLPLPLERAGGGWRNRDTAARFVEYALHVHERLGDRVAAWLTINEPWCAAFLGYATDVHAPGACDPAGALAAAHHLLLAHGQAVSALRAAGAGTIGAAINLVPVRAATDAATDRDAARRIDGLQNRLFLDTLLRGRYPEDVVADVAAVSDLGHVEAGDLEQIAVPLDVLGVNYYYTWAVAGDAPSGERPSEWVGSPHVRFVDQPLPTTDMGWFVEAPGLRATLHRVREYAPDLPLAVTECGAAYPRALDDADRVAYLDAHLREAHRAIAEGVDLRGFMAWSLLDNFEWGWGFGKRFGVVDVDYVTQRRTPRASARWYADVARANALPVEASA